MRSRWRLLAVSPPAQPAPSRRPPRDLQRPADVTDGSNEIENVQRLRRFKLLPFAGGRCSQAHTCAATDVREEHRNIVIEIAYLDEHGGYAGFGRAEQLPDSR